MLLVKGVLCLSPSGRPDVRVLQELQQETAWHAQATCIKENREKQQAASSAAPTTAVETQQPVPEPVSVELSEYEQIGNFMSGS